MRPNKAERILFLFSAILVLLIFMPLASEVKVVSGVIITVVGFLCTTLFSLRGHTTKNIRETGKKKIQRNKAKDKMLKEQSISEMRHDEREKNILEIEDSKAKADTARRVILVFGIIYSAIAALGFQVALDFYYPFMHKSISVLGFPDINNSFLILGYLSVAVLFYHGGIIFLTTVAAEELTDGKARRVFPDFIVLFLEGVIIYYIAKDLNSLQVFVKLIMTLMVVDIGWVLYFYSATKARSIYFEWVHFDLMTFLALALISLYGYGFQPYVTIFIILVSRTICDYAFAWKEFYSVYTSQP